MRLFCYNLKRNKTNNKLNQKGHAMIPEELNIKIVNLNMTPSDWGMLNKLVESHAYRTIVCKYQARERELLPHCDGVFGICRYNDHGICGYKNACKLKH